MNRFLTFFLMLLLSFVPFLYGCGTAATKWEQLYQTECDETAEEPQNTEDHSTEKQETKEQLTEAETEGTKENTVRTEKTVCVYICGAVVHAGVYELPEGSRVYQVIEAAGGLSEDADTLLINQARIVEDGEQIRIYTNEEGLDADLQIHDQNSGKTEAGKININKADKEELMTLPGIGEAKAESILEYRDAQGGFQTIEEIMNIAGIKEAVFSKIKEKITV